MTFLQKQMPLLARRMLLPLLAIGITLGMTGCDFLNLNDVGDVVNAKSEVDVPLSNAGSGLSVMGGQAFAKTDVVAPNDLPEGLNLSDILNVESVSINPADVSFTPSAGTQSAGKSAAVQQSGMITVFVVVDGYPVAQATVTVANNKVVAVEPNKITVGEYTNADLEAAFGELSDSERPDLADDYEGLTLDETQKKVNERLKENSFPVSIVVDADEGLNGTLSIDQLAFEVTV